MSPGESHTATAMLVNAGDRPLRILSAGSSCGCTVAEAPKVVPAHGRAPISVRYRSDAQGPIRQAVDVRFVGYEETPLTIAVVGMSGDAPTDALADAPASASPPKTDFCEAPKTSPSRLSRAPGSPTRPDPE